MPDARRLGRAFYVHLEGTARVVIGIWTWSPGCIDYNWPKQEDTSIEELDSGLPAADRFVLLARDYLCAAPRSISVADAGNVIEGSVFPYSAPSLATYAAGKPACLWVCDAGPSRGAADRTAVKFSVWNGTAWSAPVLIDDDGTADFAPQVASLVNGNILAAWQDAAQTFGGDVAMEVALPQCEITVAMCDAVTGVWGEAVTLTNNGHLDRTPRLATFGSAALLTWVSNPTSHYLGTPEEPNDICFATYDGATWSAPTTATTGLPSVIKTTLAYDGTTGALVYSADTDGDFSTEADRELFLLTFAGGAWTGPTRLTNDAVKDENPQVVCTTSGFLIAWYCDGQIVYSRGLDLPAHGVAAEAGASSGAADFRLAVGANGQISLVWQDASDALVDVWAAIYDPNLDLWSQPYQLTADTALERSMAVAYDSAGDLMVVYDRTTVDEQTLAFGQTDLCYLRHKLSIDLAVFAADVTFSSDNPRPGDQVQISAILRNLGGLAVQDGMVLFYNGDPDGDGMLIEEARTEPQTVAGGGTAVATIMWTVPPADAPQTVYAIADAYSWFRDGDWTNNACSVVATRPDLVISEMHAEWIGANQCNVTIRTTNQGSALCSGVHVTLRRGSTTGELLHDSVIDHLAVDASYESTFEWNLNTIAPKAGQIVFYGVADELGFITELSEINNTGFVGVVVDQWNLPGDVNGDCTVNVLDLIRVRNHLNQSVATGDNCKAGVNNDGKINVLDLINVRNRLNTKCQ